MSERSAATLGADAEGATFDGAAEEHAEAAGDAERPTFEGETAGG